MNSNLRKHIFNNLNQKETDELVEIWQTNDRVEWTAEAFDVVREILQKRLGELPPQDEPVMEHADSDSDYDIEHESLEEYSDNDDLPIFYKPQEVLWLEKWVNRAAIAAIIASVIASLLELPRSQQVAMSFFMGSMNLSLVAWLIAVVVFVFTVVLQGILIYFPLKALGFILKILMEMEFNSRGIQ